MNLKAIIANDINGGIGNKNKIPWSCKRDIDWLISVTKNKTLLVGSKTWCSLPRSMKTKYNNKFIVLGDNINDENLIHKHFTRNTDLEQILIYLDDYEEVFIFGGKTIYELFKSYINTWYINTIQGEYECDTFIDRDQLLHNMKECVFREEFYDVIIEVYTNSIYFKDTDLLEQFQ